MAVARMVDAVQRYDIPALGQLLRESVPEFTPLASGKDKASEAATVVAFPARNARRT